MRPFLLFWILTVMALSANGQVVESKIYAWNQAPVVKQAGYEERTLLDGTTTDFSNLTVQAITLPARQPAQFAQQLDDEIVLIVKAGKLTLTLGNKAKTLGPGSVAVIMPGDVHRLENRSTEPLTYYLMRYTSNDMPDLDLDRLAGGSFWVDWDEVPYTPHDKGGIRRMFDCATVMSKRAEMHITTLKPGLWSHPPHTHRAAELLLMIENTAHEQIDGVRHRADVGDLIFLEANVPHAIQNTSDRTCTYIAFQFE